MSSVNTCLAGHTYFVCSILHFDSKLWSKINCILFFLPVPRLWQRSVTWYNEISDTTTSTSVDRQIKINNLYIKLHFVSQSVRHVLLSPTHKIFVPHMVIEDLGVEVDMVDQQIYFDRTCFALTECFVLLTKMNNAGGEPPSRTRRAFCLKYYTNIW